MKNGFTLVELSIVLVIIGLLIGGIIAAQSMIATSQVTAQVAQLQQFDAAVMSFRDKYKVFVSDGSYFRGDGDNYIDRTINSSGTANDIGGFSCEMGNFWQVLFPEQYTFSYGCSNNYGMLNTEGSAKNAPLAKMGKKGNLAAVSPVYSTVIPYSYDSAYGNYYIIVNPTIFCYPHPSMHALCQWTSGMAITGITPTELYTLDKKMDDGNPSSGDVLAGGGGGGLTMPPFNSCASGSNYVLSVKSGTCVPAIRVGAQAGNPL